MAVTRFSKGIRNVDCSVCICTEYVVRSTTTATVEKGPKIDTLQDYLQGVNSAGLPHGMRNGPGCHLYQAACIHHQLYRVIG